MAVKERPFQLIVTQPIRTSAGTSSASGADSSSAQAATSAAEPIAIPKRADAAAGEIGPATGADAGGDPEHVQDGERRRGSRGRHPSLTLEEDDEEADQADLRFEHQRRRTRKAPD